MCAKLTVVALIFCIGYISSLRTDEIESKYIKIHNLDDISDIDHKNIFKPMFQSMDGATKHDIHVEDIYGKFMKLRYEATHPSNIKLFKLDIIKQQISSLNCNDDEINTIKIQFHDTKSTEFHYLQIHSHLNHDENGDYYMVGSHKWLCRDKNTKLYSPIIRLITNIQIKSSTLIFNTEYASYTDVFETLDLEFTTNAKMTYDSPSPKHTATTSTTNRRRLNWWGDFWSDITSGLQSVLANINLWVENLAAIAGDIWEGAQTILDEIDGGLVRQNATYAQYFWSYNYDISTNAAKESFSLDSNGWVTCADCYVWFDLTYTFKMQIRNGALKYLYLVGEGEVFMNAKIEGTAQATLEYDLTTPKIAIPYLSIGVGDITFGFSTNGALAIGVDIETDYYVWSSYSASGTIKKGIEYFADTNTQNYITDYHIEYEKEGPKLEFTSMNVTFYMIPTIYLQLHYVGEMWFGVKPSLQYAFTANDYSAECAIDYVPTAHVLAFVGAKIKPFNQDTIWQKDSEITLNHVVLESKEGCITQSELIDLERYLFYQGLSRRRLGVDIDAVVNSYIDYTNVSLRNKDRYYRWGSRSSEWSGNMTKLNKVCTESAVLAYGDNESFVERPGTANLLLKIEDFEGGKSMVGIYKTVSELYMEDGWDMTTNVTCLSRFNFTRINEYAEAENIFEIELLEWYCDLNLSVVGIEEESDLEMEWIEMISLPETMYAHVMSSSFGHIMLRDTNWCYVFIMAKEDKYEMSYDELLSIDWHNASFEYPSRQWFGSYHCWENGELVESSSSLYFEFVDWMNGSLVALLIDGSDRQYLEGIVNYEDFTLNLWSLEKSVTFVGVVTVMQDGTMLYSGAINDENVNCTGFVYQGYVNIASFDSNVMDLAVETDDDCASSAGSDSNLITIGIFIGIGACLLIFVVAFIIARIGGYSLNKKQVNFADYGLMTDEL